jgi:two-component system sensor histidine kinase KdpD
VEEIGDGVLLALKGRNLSAEDRRVLNAFAAQLGAARERERLAAAAATATELGHANELRAALLQAVSHDLRTPLAAIKASVSSLRQEDIHWSGDDRREFLATIEAQTDRLTSIVSNLLDMSRLQAGALELNLRPVGLDEVVPSAITTLDGRAQRVQVEVPENLPPVLADAALLERVVDNVIENACKWSPIDAPIRVCASAVNDAVHLTVIDRGRGVPANERERVFQPFQRLGDGGQRPGVGLGLAVARGFMRAMHGDLFLEDTPGGGTTAVLTLPRAS